MTGSALIVPLSRRQEAHSLGRYLSAGTFNAVLTSSVNYTVAGKVYLTLLALTRLFGIVIAMDMSTPAVDVQPIPGFKVQGKDGAGRQMIR